MVWARARFLARPRYLTLAKPHSCLTTRKACSPRARVRERARLIIRQRAPSGRLEVARRSDSASPRPRETLDRLLPVRLIAEDFPLLPVQQLRQLGDVGYA